MFPSKSNKCKQESRDVETQVLNYDVDEKIYELECWRKDTKTRKNYWR